jgi:dolichol-phosphate mannosyltransferase
VDDDSRDGTADAVRAIARRDARVRCLQRIGRRGLSTACIEGVLASSSPYIAVMDADMQHDERLLPQMLKVLESGAWDIAVGSRYVPGGGFGDWDSGRLRISGLATRLSRAICRVAIADPMSGFFMVRRHVFEGSMRQLSGEGFKILLDLLASSPQTLQVKELPFHFRTRQHGTSKLDTLVAWEFGMLLADKLIGSRVPVSFVIMAFVICLGFALYLGTSWVCSDVYNVGFAGCNAAAIWLSASAMFLFNQLFTHRDKRLGGARLGFRMIVVLVLATAMGFAGISVTSGIFNASIDSWAGRIAVALISSVTSYAVARIVSRPKRWRPHPGLNGVNPSGDND